MLLTVSVSGVSDSIFDDEISLSVLFGLMLELPSFFPLSFDLFSSMFSVLQCSLTLKVPVADKKLPVLVTPSLRLFA